MAGIIGGDKLIAHLKGMERKLSEGKALRVGFLEESAYPDGTPVAQVAYWDEYGTKTSPPRPFFRQVIAEKSSEWGPQLGNAMKSTGGDPSASLALMGEVIKDQIVESVVAFDSPALSPVTVMLRGMKYNDPSLVVTAQTVGEAARRVAEGKTNYGAPDKPLIDQGIMQRSVDYDLESEG